MKNVRRLILALSSLVGVWLFVSFGGAMFDTANAGLWTNSLMWALLSSLIVMPALLMVSLASTEDPKRAAQQPDTEQEPFIQEESDEARTLWPEPNQNPEQPTRKEQRERVRA